MTDDLKQRLRELSASRKPYPTGAHGQMVGMESYRIVANGFALECVDEAADRIEQLEKERDELLTDAMRYQWLRKKIGVDCDHISGAYVWLPTAGYRLDEYDQRTSDAAIDAAIAKLKGQS